MSGTVGKSASLRWIRRRIALILAMFLVSALVLMAEMRYTYSDPYQSSLLVSQAIIEHGTIKLDAYADDVELKNIIPKYKHKYNIFPLGAPVFSMPFVLVAKAIGKDMRHDDPQTQVAITSILCPLILLVIYKMGTCYVSERASLFISLGSFLGSSLMSTLGSALWSHVYAVLFMSLSTLLLARYDTRKAAPNPYLLGFLMFAAYLSRPIAAVYVLIALVYLLARDRRLFIKTALFFGLLFALLVVFSLREFNQILPDYYLPSRLSSENYWVAFYGLLLSPSRGVFVFSPFLFVVFAGAALFFRRLRGDRMFWFGLAWFVSYFAVIAKFPDWMSGHSFGPRYQSDSFPSTILIALILWREIAGRKVKPLARHALVFSYAATLAVAIWINSYQGLFNKWAFYWNGNPYLFKDPGHFFFDWKHPQFLATEASLREMVTDYVGEEYDVEIDFEKRTLSVAPKKPLNP